MELIDIRCVLFVKYHALEGECKYWSYLFVMNIVSFINRLGD